MNKKTVLSIVAITSFAMLTACNTSGAATNTSGQTSGNATVIEDTVTPSAADSSDNNADTSDTTEVSNISTDETNYSIKYNDVTITVNAPAQDIIDALGEPSSYFESNDCAFDGVSKSYLYGSIELDTYDLGDGVEYVESIFFMDDLVATNEDIRLFMTKEDVESAYGTPSAINGPEYVYECGNSMLSILFDDNDTISSISFNTTVLNK